MLLDNINENLEKINSLNIAVIGDYCLDKYLYIDSKLDTKLDYSDLITYYVSQNTSLPGGAGNVANNLIKLGVNVFCVGLFGDDGNGYDLKNILDNIGANTDNIIFSNEKSTNCVLKPIRKIDNNYERLNEMIIINSKKTSEIMIEKIINKIEHIVKMVDAIVIVEQFGDEQTGMFPIEVKDAISNLSKKYKDIVFLADSRKYINRYKNINLKCNQHEFHENFIKNKNEELSQSNILKYCSFIDSYKNVFVTRGEHGMMVADNKKVYDVKGISVPLPLDTCGAGDSATAGIVIALCMGYNIYEAAILGNIIASITITQLNTTGYATVDDMKKIISEFDISSLINL